MKPTRKTQPYRRGPRQPTRALAAMKRGRTGQGTNPQDTKRSLQKRRRKGIARHLSAHGRTFRY